MKTNYVVPMGALESRHARLREVSMADYEMLYRMVTLAEATSRWRFRGTTPSPEDFRSLLWRGVVGQFIIESRDSHVPVGLVTAFDADFPNGVVHLAVLLGSEAQGKGWPIEGVILFLDYIFSHWPFRKIYAESIAFNAATYLRGSRKLFTEEGCLRDHEYYRGRYWDVHVLALYRAVWLEKRRLYRSIAPGVFDEEI